MTEGARTNKICALYSRIACYPLFILYHYKGVGQRHRIRLRRKKKRHNGKRRYYINTIIAGDTTLQPT